MNLFILWGFMMKPKMTAIFTILFSCFLIFQFSHTAYAQTSTAMELVPLLTNQLGVTQDQAMGGAGALFGMAKSNLDPTNYGKVTDAIPGIDTLIAAAPAVSDQTGGITGQLGGMGKGLGGLAKTAENANKLAVVTEQFKTLGLDPSMVSKFMPIMLSFAQSQGGDTVMNILKGVWQ